MNSIEYLLDRLAFFEEELEDAINEGDAEAQRFFEKCIKEVTSEIHYIQEDE